jgi:hypothetical protein
MKTRFLLACGIKNQVNVDQIEVAGIFLLFYAFPSKKVQNVSRQGKHHYAEVPAAPSHF